LKFSAEGRGGIAIIANRLVEQGAASY
jgi:hypothetical protein